MPSQPPTSSCSSTSTTGSTSSQIPLSPRSPAPPPAFPPPAHLGSSPSSASPTSPLPSPPADKHADSKRRSWADTSDGEIEPWGRNYTTITAAATPTTVETFSTLASTSGGSSMTFVNSNGTNTNVNTTTTSYNHTQQPPINPRHLSIKDALALDQAEYEAQQKLDRALRLGNANPSKTNPEDPDDDDDDYDDAFDDGTAKKHHHRQHQHHQHHQQRDQHQHQQPQTKNVAHVGFAQALEAQQPKKWTRAMGKLYFFLLVASINSLMNAYTTTLVGTVGTGEYYNQHFSAAERKSGSGVTMSIYALGNIVGSLVCGPVADRWGRRWGMFSGGLVLVVGALVQGSARDWTAFIAGRALMGFGIALGQTAGLCYVAEMAHPAWRGPMTGLYNAVWNVGAAPASMAPFIYQHVRGNLQWRMPIYFQLLGAGTLVLSSLFIPESPRWLYANGQKEMAVRVLEKYHGEGNRKSPIVRLTYRELVQEIFIEGSDKRWWDYSDLFNSRAAWWRNACVMGLAFIGQMNGAGMITFFMPRLTKSAGITGSVQILNTSLVLSFSLISAVLGALLVDRIGRRRSLLIGSSLLVCWWTLLSVLLMQFTSPTSSTSAAGARATIAFLSIFSITYSFTFTPLQVLYPVECLSYEIRAKGMGVSNLVTNVASVFNTYGVTKILGRIGARFYWAYIALNVVYTVFMFYCFVETRGRTLEEINEIFKAPYPKAKSLEEHTLVISDLRNSLQWGLGLELELEGVGGAGTGGELERG